MRLRRLRRARKTPLAVAGILATPLFFVALMALSLALDKPTHLTQGGVEELADPTRRTIATIYLLSLGASALVVLAGVFALFLPRLAVVMPAVAAIAVTIVLLVPLGTWEADHVARYPDGVDLIAQDDPSDLILQGEWEENAHTTARQIGFWTIAIAIAAIAIAVALDVRRRRGIVSPPAPPPPPDVVGGNVT